MCLGKVKSGRRLLGQTTVNICKHVAVLMCINISQFLGFPPVYSSGTCMSFTAVLKAQISLICI